MTRFGPLMLALLCIPACGSDDKDYRLSVYPASGSVVQKGKPVPRAIVRFHPNDPAALKIPDGKEGFPIVLTTETDEQGKFSLSTYLADDGVPAGDYKVTVVRLAKAAEGATGEESLENDEPQAKRGRKPAIDKLPVKYADPKSTPLQASVKPGEENQFAFEME